jgi:hypothetical protein
VCRGLSFDAIYLRLPQAARPIASRSPDPVSARIALLFKQIRVIDVPDSGNHRMRRFKMKTFTIDGNDQILVFASKKEAAAASATDAFNNLNELAELTSEWPMQRLVGIWNGLPGASPVSKFTSRKIAMERLWKAIQSREVPAKSEPVVAETTVSEATVLAESTPDEVEPQGALAQPELAAIEPQSPAIEEPQAVPEAPAQSAEPVAAGPTQETTGKKKARGTSQKAKTQQQDSGPREGSKTAQVVAMLQREGGATLSEIMHAMGWQKHTVRGFMAGAMKKAGYTVESFRPEGGERTYRIQ